MTNSTVNNLLIPQVSKVSGQKKVDLTDKLDGAKKSEFKNLLNDQISKSNIQNEQGIKLSTHAAKRLSERNLEMDGAEFTKVRDAIDKLKTKGGRDSLVVTDKAAYIVDVANNKIVTAIDKMSMSENVFTKIDSTVFV